MKKNVKKNNKTTNILSLTSKESLDFFMKSEQYHGFELPEYFDFNGILEFVHKTIGEKTYEDCLNNDLIPDNISDVNMDILLNKDGRYAVRPIILANPYLYYFLVREVCDKNGWKVMQDCFSKFTVPHIKSCALPVVPAKKESFHKSTTILNWWNSIEQRSIELSLEYRYMFVTDITNCYGSVNPQSFDWALNMISTNFATDSNHGIAANIQKYLRAFQQGRNIGIPQGSAIFDFIGEIILGYSDLLLHEAIEKAGISDNYEIIRYRDDYRIFCNDKDELEQISYLLQQVLEKLNFRMNSQKTLISDSIIVDAIKPDKMFYIFNTPIFNKKGVDFDSFEKHLIYIMMFGKKYKDGGQIKVMLNDIDKRIEEWLKPQEREVTEIQLDNDKAKKSKIFFRKKLPGGSVRAMAAICVQIALDNVSAGHYALRVMSRIVDSLDDEKEKWDIIDKVYSKISHQPNSSYNQLWLQNITYQKDKKEKKSPYDMRLCRLVAGDKSVELWNNSWLNPKMTKKLPYKSIVNQEVLKKITPVITFRETRAYYDVDEEGYESVANKIDEIEEKLKNFDVSLLDEENFEDYIQDAASKINDNDDKLSRFGDTFEE